MSSSQMLCGRRAVTVLIVGLCVACGGSFAWAQSFGRPEVIEEARQLEQDGQAQAAFLKYFVAAGGESAAVALARPHASEFLKLLAEQGAAIPAARRRLIEAELLLATRDKVGALAAFRDAASKIATKDEQGWEQGLLPRGQYFVELPMSEGRGSYATAPFTVGPGSHRDNWLL